MVNTARNLHKPDSAEIILEAAIKRFSDYGYNKTTMAEIAEDCGMSAANIYRFYKNKKEIAITCTVNRMNEKIAVLERTINNPAISASEKLEEFILETLRLSLQAASENQKIDEICSEITRNEPDLIHEKINSNIDLLAKIISFGAQQGEFNVKDIKDAATSIYAMIVLFDVPMFMSLFSAEEYETRARSVSQLIIAGLKH